MIRVVIFPESVCRFPCPVYMFRGFHVQAKMRSLSVICMYGLVDTHAQACHGDLQRVKILVLDDAVDPLCDGVVPRVSALGH